MDEEVYVLGAGFGGINSAFKLSRQGFDVKLFDARRFHEFTPGVIDVIRQRVSEDRLKLDIRDFLEDTDIDFRREEVHEIDPVEGCFSTEESTYEYENLVIGLGGEPRDFGMDVSKAWKPYSIREVKKMSSDLDDADSAIIVGSGYVGVEVAGELAEKGMDVKVVDRATRPVSGSAEKASHLVLDYMRRQEIRFLGGREVVEVGEDFVEVEEGRSLTADVVIWSGGVRASRVVRDSFDCGPEGVEVNSGLSSERYRDVFALGDCADNGSLDTAHNAMDQSEIVAGNVGKPGSEELERYSEGKNPLVVSLGSEAIFIYGDLVFKLPFLRYLKDIVRVRYWFELRKQKLLLKFSRFLGR